MNESIGNKSLTPSQLITNRIEQLSDWRGKMYAKLRQLINETSPDLTEDWKWGTAVWTYKGLVCSVNAFKGHVKVHFFNGAPLPDPKGLFNSGLDAKEMRAIDLFESSTIDESALRELILAAIELNRSHNK